MQKVLVIDDEPSFRAAVSVTLRRQGYEVFEAGTGAEGLALSLAHRPSLILYDVNTVGTNGLELLEKFRTHPETSAVPVILMTGAPQQAGARFYMDCGADDYLEKPFTMDQLLTTVRARGQADRTAAWISGRSSRRNGSPPVRLTSRRLAGNRP